MNKYDMLALTAGGGVSAEELATATNFTAKELDGPPNGPPDVPLGHGGLQENIKTSCKKKTTTPAEKAARLGGNSKIFLED